MSHAIRALLILILAVSPLPPMAFAQRGEEPGPLRSVLTRDEWVREWVVRVESSSWLVGEPADSPGTEPDIIRLAYPLPATFAWGGVYNDTLWTRIELPNGRSGNDYFLELADDGTTNLIAEIPNRANPLEFEYRATFSIQTHAINDIDEQRATSQYIWPGPLPPDIAGYLEPEPFIESNHDRIKAFVSRATRNRSPRSVPPYQLAKHLAAEVIRFGESVGPAYALVPETISRRSNGQLYYDDRSVRERGNDPRAPLVRTLINPSLDMNLIRGIARRMPGAQPLQTLLRGNFPGINAPPTPVYFQRANNSLPSNLHQHLQFCAPRHGFLVQSALHASLGEQITDEGLANLLVAVYRAAGIPARLTIVIDQRAVLRRDGIEPITVELGDRELRNPARARPIRVRHANAASRPRLATPVLRRTPGIEYNIPPMEPDKKAVPSHVGGFPTNAIFRPLVEFYLTDEDATIGEWIPVDIVRMRTEFNPPPALDTKWEHFGRLRNADMLIPVAHHWVAPGHAFTDRPHLWGIWPAFTALTREGQSPHRTFTCIWASERIITGDPEPERSLILPARSPN